MLFSSAEFVLAFLPLTALLYFTITRHFPGPAGKLWLICASLFFYGYWNPAYLFLLLGSIGINFVIGRSLHRNSETALKLSRKQLLVCGIVFNLGLLGWFKYVDFLITNVNAVSGADIPALNLLLPLAISFFTFQQIAYLADCYQSDTQDYEFTNYALFVTFFPQLIAGPIVHHREMMPQFARTGSQAVNWDNVTLGLFVFSIGLFKKIIIADQFAVWADAGFDSRDALTLFEAWCASLSYTFQLYFDFSGYCDMATGAALIFNIRLPINFNSPYKASNIQDFWRRWHITLSNWLRDYLYIPLGGNKHGPGRTSVNLATTFLLGGLWHGAGWTFLLWGLLHGAALAIHRTWQMLGHRMPRFWGWFCTFLFVNWAWVIFRATDLERAISIWKGMLGLHGIAVTPKFAEKLEKVFSPEQISNHVTLADITNTVSGDSVAAILFFTVFCACAANALQLIGMIPYKGRLAFRSHPLTAVAHGLLTGYCIMYIVTTRSEVFLYFNF